jgi:hypothetical protein
MVAKFGLRTATAQLLLLLLAFSERNIVVGGSLSLSCVLAPAPRTCTTLSFTNSACEVP